MGIQYTRDILNCDTGKVPVRHTSTLEAFIARFEVGIDGTAHSSVLLSCVIISVIKAANSPVGVCDGVALDNICSSPNLAEDNT